jgi:hypothetical protein
MDRILARLHRNHLQGRRSAAADQSTTPTIATADNVDTLLDIHLEADLTTVYPLEFLSDECFWEATIVRSAIVNAIGNIQAMENQCQTDFQHNRQTVAQREERTQVHRNQIQRLAQLGNRHAQLCYSFNHTELLAGTIRAIEDPTYCCAIHGCITEINLLNLEYTNPNVQHDRHPTHPDVQHHQVVVLVQKWYPLSFHCSLAEFQKEIWWHQWIIDLGNIVGTHDYLL